MAVFEISEKPQESTYNLQGKISDDGKLWIARIRNGEQTFIGQECVFCKSASNDDKTHLCGDHCPMFGEIEAETKEAKITIDGRSSETRQCTLYSIPICNGRTLRFMQIEDKRRIKKQKESAE